MTNLAPASILNYDFGSFKGYLAENFVCQEFNALEKKIFYWHENTSELEFLFSENDKVTGVEVKSGQNTKAKSLTVFLKKYLKAKSIVFSTKHIAAIHQDHPLQNRTMQIPIYAAGFLPVSC